MVKILVIKQCGISDPHSPLWSRKVKFSLVEKMTPLGECETHCSKIIATLNFLLNLNFNRLLIYRKFGCYLPYETI